jgi:hypothetical protein
MPRGPKGEKSPRDANQLAKLIVDIATGQVEDREPTPEEQGKNPAAVAFGKSWTLWLWLKLQQNLRGNAVRIERRK